MSTQPLRCRACDQDCVYDRCTPFGEGQEGVYAVAWRCPNGHGLSVDVCPLGPLVASAELCLNCGDTYPSDGIEARCGACGLTRGACVSALGIADMPADPISAARAAFAQGLFRRAMAILNYVIREGGEPLEAWFLRTRFLNSLGFNRTAAEMLNVVLGRFSRSMDRISLREEQSFLWAECECGEEALRSADEALALGSTSVRTHYLRGRALGLLGRLEEARDEMNQVLTVDPHNADAQRGLTMIEGALGSKRDKRWWEFWKRRT